MLRETVVGALPTPVEERQINLAGASRMELPPGKPLTNASVRSGAWPHAIKSAASTNSSKAIQTDVSPARTATAMVIPSRPFPTQFIKNCRHSGMNALLGDMPQKASTSLRGGAARGSRLDELRTALQLTISTPRVHARGQRCFACQSDLLPLLGRCRNEHARGHRA